MWRFLEASSFATVGQRLHTVLYCAKRKSNNSLGDIMWCNFVCVKAVVVVPPLMKLKEENNRLTQMIKIMIIV